LLRYRPDEVPVENKSFSGLFFVLGILSLVVAWWVIFNEFETRRPYKKYQRDFYALERTRVRSTVADLETQLRALDFDPGDTDAIVNADASITSAEVDTLARGFLAETYGDVAAFSRKWGSVNFKKNPDGTVELLSADPTARSFTRAQFENDITLFDLTNIYNEEDGKLRVQKSLKDAEYYQYSVERHAIESEARQFGAAVQFKDTVLDPRDAVIDALDVTTSEMRNWLAEFQKVKGAEETRRGLAATEGYADRVKETATELAAARDEFDLVDYSMLEMLANFGTVKRVQIQQVQLTGLGPVLNDMDRCQSCHIAATKAGYEWWIHDTFSVIENGVICRAEPHPRRAGRWNAITELPMGDTYSVQLSRPTESGLIWNDLALYVNGIQFFPENGYEIDEGTIYWGEEFAQSYLAQGAIIEVFQSYPKLYRTHPHRAEIFGAHPVESYGCTTCHDGQGRALTWSDAGCDFREDPHNPASPTHWWKEGVLTSLRSDSHAIDEARSKLAAEDTFEIAALAEDLYLPTSELVDYETTRDTDHKYRQHSNFHPNVNGEPVGDFGETKCQLCHGETLELAFAPSLSKGKRLFERLGCHGCHFAADYSRVVYDPALDYIEHRRWQVGPSLSYDEKLGDLVGASDGERGRGLGWKLNEDTGKAWLVNWLKSPRSYLAKTRMPNYRLSDAEAQAISAFVLTATGWVGPDAGSSIAGVDDGGFRAIADTDPPLDPESVRQGELLVANIGCLACHTITEADGTLRGNSFGPDLSAVGSKVSRTFLEQWLENPRSYDPKTIMPAMFDNVQGREKRRQIRAVTDYLLSLDKDSWDRFDGDFEITDELVAEGEKLFGPSGKGCVGCHFLEADMPDGEGGTRLVGGQGWVGQQIGPELTDLATKTPEFLDYGFTGHRRIAYYGDIEDLKWGEVVGEHGDGAVTVRAPSNHAAADPYDWRGMFYKEADEVTEVTLDPNEHASVTEVHHTWHDWVFNKLKEPNVFATEANAVAQNMPNFYLTDDEAAALLVLLKSFRGENEIPEEYRDHLTKREQQIERGRNLTIRYNCAGCHAIEESFATGDGRLIKGWAFGRHSRDENALPTYPGPDGVDGTADDIKNNGWGVSDPAYGRAMTIQRSYDGSDPDAGVHGEQVELNTEEIVRTDGAAHVGFDSVGNTFSYMRAGYPVETGRGRTARVQHGPVLTFAGERFRPEWLFEFLKRPYPVRQYLFDRDQGRMPYFQMTDTEAGDVVAYFMALAGETYPYEEVVTETDPALVEIGANMFQNDAKCSAGACHPAAEPGPGNLAPWLKTAERLKPEWIAEWVTNPDDFWPGNGMPLFPWEIGGQALYPAYAGGDVPTQMHALRDYVLTLAEE
jgi:mono/diheme cytochrome c family protein